MLRNEEFCVKKRWKKSGCIMLALMLAINAETIVFADQISDLKKKNEETKNELDRIDDKLDNLSGEQQSIVEQMDDLDAQIVEIMTSISILEDEIKAKKEEIEQAKLDLEAAIEDENNQYEAMKIRIHYMYENGNVTYLDILLQASSMDDILNKADYVEKIYDYDRKMLEEFQAIRQKVEDLKEQLEIEESELEVAQEECEEEKAGMEEALAELKLVNADYEARIAEVEAQAKVYKEQIKKQNAEIARLEEEERKKAEEAAKKAAAQNNGTTSSTTVVKGTATVNKEEILAANGSDLGKQIAIYACGFVGNPYVSGGTSLTNGADCSGFTQSLYKAYGYNIPRTSYSQRTAGTEVSYAEAQPGDIICYAGHVALYIGNGKIVHASSPSTGIKIGTATYKQILTVRRIIS